MFGRSRRNRPAEWRQELPPDFTDVAHWREQRKEGVFRQIAMAAIYAARPDKRVDDRVQEYLEAYRDPENPQQEEQVRAIIESWGNANPDIQSVKRLGLGRTVAITTAAGVIAIGVNPNYEAPRASDEIAAVAYAEGYAQTPEEGDDGSSLTPMTSFAEHAQDAPAPLTPDIAPTDMALPMIGHSRQAEAPPPVVAEPVIERAPQPVETNEIAFRNNITRLAKEQFDLKINEIGNTNAGPEIQKYTQGYQDMWCGFFVSWLYKESGHAFTGGSAIFPEDWQQGRVGWSVDTPHSMRQWFNNNAYFFEKGQREPNPGDVVFIRYGGPGDGTHVALFYEWVDKHVGTFRTIDGNYDEKVSVVNRSMHDSIVSAFGSVFPESNAQVTPPPAPAPPSIPTLEQPGNEIVPVQLPTGLAVPQPDREIETNPDSPGSLILSFAEGAQEEVESPAPPAGGPILSLPLFPQGQAPPQAPAGAEAPPPAPQAPPAPERPPLPGHFPEQAVNQFDVTRERFNELQPIYESVARHEGIPWQMLAAVHLRECGLDLSVDQSTLAGEKLGTRNPDHPEITVHTFEEGLHYSARFLKDMFRYTYDGDIRPDGNSFEEVQKIFLAYNRGNLYKKYRVSPDRSPYVMNQFDNKHIDMKWTRGDTAKGKDTNLGAMTVYVLLSGPIK